MDTYITSYVKRRLAEAQGRYSNDERLADAEAEANEKEQRLNAAVATFDGLGDVAAIRAKLLEMQAESESARARLDELRATFGTAHAFLGRLWDDLTLAEQRSILRVFIKRIVVTRGRGRPDERITIDAFED